MSPRPILGVWGPSCVVHNDKTIKAILCDAPGCFNGGIDMTEGHKGYIFQRFNSEDFHTQLSQQPFSAKKLVFSLLRFA